MVKESIRDVEILEFIIYSCKHWKNINLIDSRSFYFGKTIEEYKNDLY